MNPAGPPINFLNVSYFFQLLYNLIVGVNGNPFLGADWASLLSTLWIFITLLAYLFCIVCIGVIVYYSTRLYQIADEERAKFTTISKDAIGTQLEHSRWNHIKQLIESPQESDWRSAIIEADIMLDELLTKIGLVGDTVGDKLKMTSESHFHTLQDAWEAHKIRNDIAHQGSSFELSPNVAYRTVGRYENVFREFNEI
jgi:hypothetical protein